MVRFLLSLFVYSFAINSFGAMRTQDALLLEINKNGFDLLADEVKKAQLNDINNATLPNIHEKVYGIDVDVSGITYRLSFDSLRFTPHQGAISVDLGVKAVRVFASQTEFKKKLLVTLSSTCKNISMAVGHSAPLHLVAKLIPTVVNGRVVLKEDAIQFSIAENNFQVSGPSECSGILGIGHVVKWVVSKILSHSREKVEATVRSKVASFLPFVESRLNDQIIRVFPLAFQVPGLSKTTKLNFLTAPSGIDFTKEKMAFRLAVDVTSTEADFHPVANSFGDGGMAIAGVGLNPALLTESFDQIFPSGTPWVELTTAMFAQANELLSLRTMQALFPDLKTIELGEDRLRALIRLNGAPQFNSLSDEAKVSVLVPELQIRFLAHRDGEWRDYYLLKLKLGATTVMDIASGNFTLKMAPENILGISGEWPKNYQPNDPTFEIPLAEFLFKAAFEYLSSQESLVRIGLPTVDLGTQKVGFSSLTVASPFVKAEISTQ